MQEIKVHVHVIYKAEVVRWEVRIRGLVQLIWCPSAKGGTRNRVVVDIGLIHCK